MVRNIGLVIAVIAIGGFILYWIFNWFVGRREIGSEIYTAPNRKSGTSDEEMETRRLDLGLSAGLMSLLVIGIALPLYWLGEPGRQEGRVEHDDHQAVDEGKHLYEERCASCHGTVKGSGGSVSHVLLDNNNAYISTVSWRAPSLSAVFYRFSEDEVRYVLDYGRPNTPMAAWGAPGGGPFTTQQIESILAYLEDEQILTAALRDRVDTGIINTAREKVLAENPELVNDLPALEQAVADLLELAAQDQILYGELIFNNVGDSGAFGCARCHTPGWSYDADEYLEEAAGLINAEVPGGGGFGPNLRDDATLRQFDTAVEHQDFVFSGSQNGVRYGNYGQGDGGGQMPSFGMCVGDRDAADRDRIKRHEFCLIHNSGILDSEQLAAVVAYERSERLNDSN